MTAALLLAYTAAVAYVLPRPLSGAGWSYRAPRLAILAWHASGAAAIAAPTAAALTALVHWSPTHDAMCAAWQVCLHALTGGHGRAGQVAAVGAVALLCALAVRLATAWRRVVIPTERVRRHQLAILRLAGTPRGDIGATVVPDPDPAAYLVPGARPQVVVTTGALDRLSRSELAAVLAHEHAHERGRHHRLRDTAHLLQRAFPRVPVFAHAAAQVDRLVELCADDVAVRRHSALALARALVAMAAPQPAGGGLHVGGGDTSERLHRLLEPPPPVPWPAQALAALAWLLLPVVPVFVVVLARFAPGLAGHGGVW